MNKKFILVALSLVSLNAYANWSAALNLGVNAVNIDKDLTYPLGDPFTTSESYRHAYTGFHGQLAVAYDLLFTEKVRIAIEGDADLFTGRARHVINNWFIDESVLAKEKLNYGFSLFALPEYHYNESFRIFAGPGVSRSQFKIDSTNTAGNAGVTGNFEQWLTGISAKVGVANKLSANKELLFTYQFTQYDSVTKSAEEPLSGEFLRGRYKPQANLFMVGLRVAFA
ncbi:porin family protein [Legionella sp. 16cNR16C]|uniref:outer membrane beta-barrel protein n=1 Tax=Legionella sp. 16cNR16C TaxID=2905656 RepID=UPI001E5FDC7C|nr:porin family protein [Legionella sp. 16cNR16C]MCE3046460.1 porin family protein [Legionella sp. 16cNR16C]